MSEKMMKVKEETKEKLEILKTTYRESSLSDVVERLIYENKQLEKRLEEQRQEDMAFKNVVTAHYVSVGDERKNTLQSIVDDYKLDNDAQVVDLLLDVYYSTKTIDRNVFDKWMLKK